MLILRSIGIFQSFSNDYDARAIKIPLAAAQELLGSQGMNALVISLKKTEDTDRVAAWLKEQLGPSDLEVKTWVELNDFYEKTVELYKSQFGVLQLIILVMVLLSVANSVNMSIFERTGEFGTMMALGNRPRPCVPIDHCRELVAWCNGGLRRAGPGMEPRDGYISNRHSHATATKCQHELYSPYPDYSHATDDVLLHWHYGNGSGSRISGQTCFQNTCRRGAKAEFLI